MDIQFSRVATWVKYTPYAGEEPLIAACLISENGQLIPEELIKGNLCAESPIPPEGGSTATLVIRPTLTGPQDFSGVYIQLLEPYKPPIADRVFHLYFSWQP